MIIYLIYISTKLRKKLGSNNYNFLFSFLIIPNILLNINYQIEKN